MSRTRRAAHLNAVVAVGALCHANCGSSQDNAPVQPATTTSGTTSVPAAETEPAGGSAGFTPANLDVSWAQQGFFPGVGDDYLLAFAEWVTMGCCSSTPDSPSSINSCALGIYPNIRPRMHWLACVTRLAEDSQEVVEYMQALDASLRAEAACSVPQECQMVECQQLSEPEPPVAVSECPSRTEELCPDGRGFSNGVRCNGVEDCADGFDELNCPEVPEGFLCEKGGDRIPWLGLCDGVADCASEVDETTCFPPSSTAN